MAHQAFSRRRGVPNWQPVVVIAVLKNFISLLFLDFLGVIRVGTDFATLISGLGKVTQEDVSSVKISETIFNERR